MPTPRTILPLKRALPLATSIAAIAAVSTAAPAAHAADGPAVARLERIAYSRLGPDALGCAYAKDASSPVQLKVTDKAALPAARRIAASMRFPVTVRLISRRYGANAMAKVARRLNQAAEGRSNIAIVGDQTAIRPSTCSLAQIWFGAENAAWAIGQQNRFGGDRVTLKLVEPGGRIPR